MNIDLILISVTHRPILVIFNRLCGKVTVVFWNFEIIKITNVLNRLYIFLNFLDLTFKNLYKKYRIEF